MPGRLRIAALDTVLDLEFPAHAPGAFVDAVEHAWSRCLAEGTLAPTSGGQLVVNAPRDDDDEAIRGALQLLSQDVTHQLIAAQTGRLLMFHAGAVSDPATGATLVYVAPSGTGKTTLSRLLGRTHSYLTDETVGIHPASGRIHPYPKPLSVAHGERWRKVETSPDELGLLPAHPAPWVARIVVLNREEAHARRAGVEERPVGGEDRPVPLKERPVRAEELGTLDAIAALVPETSALNRLPRPLHTLAHLLERTGPLLRLTYREAADLVPVAAKLIEDATPTVEAATPTQDTA